MTKGGQFPMPESQEEVWVTEDEIRSAVKHIDNLAEVVVSNVTKF